MVSPLEGISTETDRSENVDVEVEVERGCDGYEMDASTIEKLRDASGISTS